MSAPPAVRKAPKLGREPIVLYDFSQGRIAENLPPLARDALRRRGHGTHKLEAELRSYLRYRGVDEVRPISVLKIVNRYVRVRPVSYAEMEAALGRQSARDFYYPEVPAWTWWIQDFLDYLDPQVGYRHRVEIGDRIQRGPYPTDDYRRISLRHLRRTGYDTTRVMRWIKEDPTRWNEWRRGLARAVGVRP